MFAHSNIHQTLSQQPNYYILIKCSLHSIKQKNNNNKNGCGHQVVENELLVVIVQLNRDKKMQAIVK